MDSYIVGASSDLREPTLRAAFDARAFARTTTIIASRRVARHHLTLTSALEAAGCVTSTESEIVGPRGDDEPMVFQRAWFA